VRRPDDAELRLVGQAVSALRRATGHPSRSAAVRTEDGEVVTAVSLGPTVCAEAAALGAALSRGTKAVTLVAVRHLSDDATRVSAPCAGCRQLLKTYAPGIRVVHLNDGLRVSGVDGLPPV
jgi:cytidine deaminase